MITCRPTLSRDRASSGSSAPSACIALAAPRPAPAPKPATTCGCAIRPWTDAGARAEYARPRPRSSPRTAADRAPSPCPSWSAAWASCWAPRSPGGRVRATGPSWWARRPDRRWSRPSAGSRTWAAGPRATSFDPRASAGRRATVIASRGEQGALYGAFHLLRLIQTGQPIAALDVRAPRHQRRLLEPLGQPRRHHRARLRGPVAVEMGRAARPRGPARPDYARANASIGINGSVHQQRQREPEIAQRAVPREGGGPGARAPPLRHPRLPVRRTSPRRRCSAACPTADPLDPAVARWWRDKADEIYARDPRLRRLPGQGQQRGPARPPGLRPHARRRRQRPRRRRARRTAAS